jgi:hypothetical protein
MSVLITSIKGYLLKGIFLFFGNASFEKNSAYKCLYRNEFFKKEKFNVV